MKNRNDGFILMQNFSTTSHFKQGYLVYRSLSLSLSLSHTHTHTHSHLTSQSQCCSWCALVQSLLEPMWFETIVYVLFVPKLISQDSLQWIKHFFKSLCSLYCCGVVLDMAPPTPLEWRLARGPLARKNVDGFGNGLWFPPYRWLWKWIVIPSLSPFGSSFMSCVTASWRFLCICIQLR